MQRQHVCPTARHSVYLTLRPSVIRQASRPAHMYFCLLLFCICIPVHLSISITFIHTMSSIYVCVFASICPYTAMCPCVCLPHSSILYTPFVHSYALCSLHTCPKCLPVSLMPDTHFFLFRLFCIHMLLYVSIYLSVTFIHTMSPICVYLSLSPHLPLILRHYVGIACVQLCSSVLSYACFHINSS